MKPKPRNRGLVVFVTVGSTSFDGLINKMLTDEVIDTLCHLNFVKMVIQAGRSEYKQDKLVALRRKMTIDLYNYKASIQEDIAEADVIVGHAGAGTCLEVLRLGKKLVIVANDQLMDNHQSELAQELDNNMYAVKTTLEGLSESLERILVADLEKFPERNSVFEEVFDDALQKANARL